MTKTQERVFVSSPQTRATHQENPCRYDKLAAGQTVYAYVANNPVNWIDPNGLQFADAAMTGYGLPEALFEMYAVWMKDTPSNSDEVRRLICQYWRKSGRDAGMAEALSDADRGARGPSQEGYDLSLRDVEHYFLAYQSPKLAAVIPWYSLFKSNGFDFPQASQPTFSEITWGMRGAWDGMSGKDPCPCE